MATIHLVPRGVVTDDIEVADLLYKTFSEMGIPCQRLRDDEWEKVYVREITGVEIIAILKQLFKGRDDIKVYAYFSRVEL